MGYPPGEMDRWRPRTNSHAPMEAQRAIPDRVEDRPRAARKDQGTPNSRARHVRVRPDPGVAGCIPGLIASLPDPPSRERLEPAPGRSRVDAHVRYGSSTQPLSVRRDVAV